MSDRYGKFEKLETPKHIVELAQNIVRQNENILRQNELMLKVILQPPYVMTDKDNE